MSKLFFYYGTMGSSKTAEALMNKFQYEEAGKFVWLIKPSTDNRDDIQLEDGSIKTIIKSRVGIQSEAQIILPTDNIVDIYLKLVYNNPDIELPIIIICDECQFLTEEQIDQLNNLVNYMDATVLCYGLRTDFATKLFPGSKRLMEIANKVIEIKSVCHICGAQSIVNARFNSDGKLITEGEQIDIGGNEKYTPLCYKCYNHLKQRGR